MPTLPRDDSPVPLDLHRARRMAESFGVDAAGYDEARPRYPEELVRRITGGRRGLRVLDIGCGTGVAARQFRAAGCTVLGVEPDARMAAFARDRGLRVERERFEDWAPAGRVFDIVTAAQSWHWVDPETGTRRAAEALRPGGLLAIFGHVFEPPEDIAGAFAEAFRRAVPDSPFAGSGRRALDTYQRGYQRIADDLRGSGAFSEVDRWRFDWTREYLRDDWLALLATTGGLTPLDTERKAGVLHAVGAAIDARGGGFTMEYVTLATVGRRCGDVRTESVPTES